MSRLRRFKVSTLAWSAPRGGIREVVLWVAAMNAAPDSRTTSTSEWSLRAILAGGDEVLRLVGQQDQQVELVALRLGQVEPAEHVEVEELLEEGAQVPALGLQTAAGSARQTILPWSRSAREKVLSRENTSAISGVVK